jgi:hypothetical protein
MMWRLDDRFVYCLRGNFAVGLAGKNLEITDVTHFFFRPLYYIHRSKILRWSLGVPKKEMCNLHFLSSSMHSGLIHKKKHVFKCLLLDASQQQQISWFLFFFSMYKMFCVRINLIINVHAVCCESGWGWPDPFSSTELIWMQTSTRLRYNFQCVINEINIYVVSNVMTRCELDLYFYVDGADVWPYILYLQWLHFKAEACSVLQMSLMSPELVLSPGWSVMCAVYVYLTYLAQLK